MASLTRRTVIGGAIGAAGAAGASLVARAQNWPSGATIRFVVPYPPGGSTDVIARMVQPMLQQRLGATVIIDNRPGASGVVGTAAVVKSPPDGNTWIIVFDNHAANPYVMPNVSFDTAKDLDPVLLIGNAPYLIATSTEKRQGEGRFPQLWLRRQRQHRPSRDDAAGETGGRLDRPCPLSRRRTRHE